MFENTGTLSFILYGIFIAITLIAMVIAFFLIVKGNIDQAKLNKIVELFKYGIVTVSIATVSLIVSNLFKERDQDVKELEYFHRYADDVKKVDGIQQRFELSKYLSIVAPSGELKRSWKQYYDTLKIEYDEYLRSKADLKKLDSVDNPTPEQKEKQQKLNDFIERKESPLVSTQTTLSSRVYIQIAGDDQRALAETLRSTLQNESFDVPGIENVGKRTNMFIPLKGEVRYFADEELPEAQRLITIIKSVAPNMSLMENPRKIRGKVRARQFEIWFPRS